MKTGPDIYCVRLVGGLFDKTELCITKELPPEIRMPLYLKDAQAGDKVPSRVNYPDDFIVYVKVGRDTMTTEFLYKVTT